MYHKKCPRTKSFEKIFLFKPTSLSCFTFPIMKVCAISDTHNKHHRLELQPADLLIHAGDFSELGRQDEVQQFLNWFARQPHPHKVFIAGNHDFLPERQPKIFKKMIPPDLIYLEDEEVIIKGIKIWGSPITPWFYNWAFNRRRGAEIRKYWEMIPKDTDILVTHGPPLGILDRNNQRNACGCADLMELVQERKPRFHLFGHIHEAYGQVEKDGTRFINACVLNDLYQVKNPPVYFEIEPI